MVIHNRYEDKDRLTATKTVVLEYLGRHDVHTCTCRERRYPEEKEETFAMEPEVVSSSLSSGMRVQSWEGY